MTAKDQIAAMLNELMGPGRNAEKNLNLNFRDQDVCKFFLAGFCPHDEFVNTRADLGSCRYVHDENLRIAYRNSEYVGKLGYERTFYYFLKRIHDDMMRKIERNKERLTLTQGVQEMDDATRKQLEAKIEKLEREMSDYVDVAERAGSRGDLDRSQKYVRRAEEVNAELDSVRKLLSPEAQQEIYSAGYKDPNAPKPMRVCEVCGSFLIIGDVQQRIDDHMQGKQHLGYAKITATMEELKAQLRDEVTPDRDGNSNKEEAGSPPTAATEDKDNNTLRRRHRSRSRGEHGNGGKSHKSDKSGSSKSGGHRRHSSTKKSSRSRSRDGGGHRRRRRSSSRDDTASPQSHAKKHHRR